MRLRSGPQPRARRCDESVLQAHDGREWERSVAARIGPPRAIASTALKKSSCSRFVIRYVTGFASRDVQPFR
ncbi:hypothetical protein WJ03_09025 [Burkholderia vietnamiensis]|nr:hypothetical protein WJ03_09025 [Burkholderia vietnamiensis]